MKDENKTKKQLISELKELRRRTAELEKAEAKHRRAEEALRESESKYRSLIENLKDIVFTIDLGGKITFASQSTEEILGYKSEEVINKNIIDFVPVENRQRAIKTIPKGMKGEKITQYQTQAITKSGERVILEVSFSRVYGKGATVGALAVARDITDRKWVEEAMQWTERELAIRNQIANIFLTVPDDKMYGEVLQVILEAADSKYGVFGYIDENGAYVVPSMTRHIWDRCQVPDKDIVFPREKWGDSIWPHAIREKKTLYSNERSTLTPEGHIPILRNITVPIIDRGEVIGLFQVANKETDYDREDIQLSETIANAIAPVLNARLQRDRQEKELKQAEEEIREVQERFYGLYNSSKDAIGWADPDGKLVDVNPSFSELTGYSKEELLTGKRYQDLTPEEYREWEVRLVEEVMKTGKPAEYEKEYIRKDGSRVPILLTVFDVKDSEGKSIGAAAIIKDITDRKQAEKELKEKMKDLEIFHDATVDRELKMEEMRKRIAELEREEEGK